MNEDRNMNESLIKSITKIQLLKNREECGSDGGSSGRSDGNDKSSY